MNKKLKEVQGISKEKLEWMEEVGIKEFDKPMKYYRGMSWLYSEEHIKNTPLEELKRKYDKRLINLGEPIFDDNDIKLKTINQMRSNYNLAPIDGGDAILTHSVKNKLLKEHLEEMATWLEEEKIDRNSNLGKELLKQTRELIMQHYEIRKLKEKETAPEVSVQEQYVGKCNHCNKNNKVTLPNRLKPQFCMNCGHAIVYQKNLAL